jgi:hypothetical protein
VKASCRACLFLSPGDGIIYRRLVGSLGKMRRLQHIRGPVSRDVGNGRFDRSKSCRLQGAPSVPAPGYGGVGKNYEEEPFGRSTGMGFTHRNPMTASFLYPAGAERYRGKVSP